MSHSRGIISLLLDLLVSKEKPVETKDTVRVAFIFSLLAYNLSRDNSALAKTRSLVLQSHGATVEGLDVLAKLGVCETGRSTLNNADMLAEVGDSMLKASCSITCSQATIDNLDFMDQHMTIKFIEPETIDTSHLNGESMPKGDIPNLFSMNLVLMESAENSSESNHVDKVAGNTVGRLIAEKLEKVILRKGILIKTF